MDLCLYRNKVSLFLSLTGSDVAQAGLKLNVELRILASECWGYRQESAHFMALGTEPGL